MRSNIAGFERKTSKRSNTGRTSGESRGPPQGQPCQDKVSSDLRDRDQHEKPPEWLAQNAGDHRERIADHGSEAQQQRPIAPTRVMAFGAPQRLVRHRKEAPASEAFDAATEQPVGDRAEDIAEARSSEQKNHGVALGDKQRDERRFRLPGKNGGREKCRKENARKGRSVTHYSFAQEEMRWSGYQELAWGDDRSTGRRNGRHSGG